VRLAGTLTEPQGAGPFPTVVLVSGSGRNARNEEVFDHKIFLVLADSLTRQGLAVLRYDKRGAGESKGDYAKATTADFAADAAAAVAYLRSRPDIDGRRLGLIGHSEGGMIVPMLAAKDPSLAFVVLMAGPGVPGRILLPEQERLIGLAMGEPKAEADGTYVVMRRLYDAVATAKDAPEAQARAREILAAAVPKPPEPVAADLVKLAGSDWFRFFMAFDPVPVLRQVRVPVLVLNGSKDLQVPPSIDLPPIRAALARDKDVTIVEMPGLNHLFQHATTGSPAEYGRIEETLAPELLETVSAWIGTHVK
jgi:pimeloyl-ACP methyl ester carboxylesterase